MPTDQSHRNPRPPNKETLLVYLHVNQRVVAGIIELSNKLTLLYFKAFVIDLLMSF